MSISFSITCFMGKQRSGKTLSMISTSYIQWKKIKEIIKDLETRKNISEIEKDRLEKFKKYELWSNLNLNPKIWGKYTRITPKELLEMYKAKTPLKYKLLVLDDLFKDMDSRNSFSEENKALSYFTTEIGKNQNILNYVSHFSHRVEKRLREMTENFILCKKGKFFSIKMDLGEQVYIFKNVWLEDYDYYEENAEIKNLKEMVIKQITYNEYIDFESEFGDIVKREDSSKLNYLTAFKYFKYYNTEEVI